MTCKDCYHYETCGGFLPSDMDKDVWDLCAKGKADEIPDIEDRCSEFEKHMETAHGEFLKRLNEAYKKQNEKQEELIKEGKPYIVYFRGVTESGRQVFLTEEDCTARIKELEKAGYLVNRIQ